MKDGSVKIAKVGIIGIGYWRSIALDVAKYFPHIQIERIWSRSEGRAEELALELSTISGNACKAMNDNLDLEGLDMAIIALPPLVAQKVLLRAIDLGIPSIVEKPLSLNPAEIHKFKILAEQRSVPISVNMQARFLPELHALRSLVKDEAYGPLHEVTVQVLGNTGGHASPIPHTWLHEIDQGGGVRGISGPHAAEFVISLAGPGNAAFSKNWTEVRERKDKDGTSRPCTADDNALVVTEHKNGCFGTIRIGTTSRKAEEVWSARCDNATIRYAADRKLVVVENFGKTTELPSDRASVLNAFDLGTTIGLLNCSDRSFPSLALLNVFAKRLAGEDVDLPTLGLLEECMSLMADGR